MLLDFNEKEKRAKMELSILLMEQIAKLFIMIFMGYAVVKMGLLKDEDSKVLSTLVLYLIVPCVILNAFQVDYTPEKVSGLELACIASLLLLFILLPIVNLIGKVLHLNEVETMSIYYSNSGNLIVPLVAFMLGDKWVFYACVFMGNQRIIAGNAQFTGIAAGRGVGFTTGLLLLREGLGMRETPIRPHSWH